MNHSKIRLFLALVAFLAFTGVILGKSAQVFAKSSNVKKMTIAQDDGDEEPGPDEPIDPDPEPTPTED